MEARFEVVRNEKKEFFYKLFGDSGNLLVTSRQYSVPATCEGGLLSLKRVAPSACIEDRTVSGAEVKPHPKYEIYAAEGGVQFLLKARNGETIAFGGTYPSRAECVKAIKELRDVARKAPRPVF